MKFEATFSERGRVMTRTYDKQDSTKEDVIERFGLRKDRVRGRREDKDRYLV